MLGYNTTSKSWRLWDPAEPLKITNSAEVSFREVDARDVARPVHGSGPCPEQGQIFQPGIITGAETRDEEPEPAEPNDGPDEEPPVVRKSGRTTKPRDRLNLFTTEQVFETEYALVIGVQGFHEAETGTDNAAPVASLQAVHLIVAHAAKNGLVLRQADIRTAFLHARMEPGSKPVFLLGMEINRDRAAGTILFEQEAYTNAVLDKFGMADARPTTSPSEVGLVSVVEDEVMSAEDTTYFRSATGSLLYLSRNSNVYSEFVALSKGYNIIKYFRHLLDTINQIQEEATVVWEDNSRALKLTRSFRITPRTTHIDVKFHHVRSLVADEVVDVKQISTSLQKADTLRKG
ncbi:unnamed protein product [Ectocarpus sp. CCAP 1310/34]|nr:unnamed protein product [Ectocarpus sp. CCAP 1310/34]